MENNQVLQDLNNYNYLVTQRPFATYSEDARNDSVPTSSGEKEKSASPDENNTAATSTVEDPSVQSSLTRSVQEQENLEDYTQNNLSDIETVSSSKADGDFKAPPPRPVTPNSETDKEDDMEPDILIDTDNAHLKLKKSVKEETTVTSTAEVNSEIILPIPDVNLSSETIKSSNLLFDDIKYTERTKKKNSEDDCPNLNIFSKESITVSKNTDIDLNPPEDKEDDKNTNTKENNQVGEVSLSLTAKSPEQVTSPRLYSTSENKFVVTTVVQKSLESTYMRNMTENDSDEKKNFIQCLDEKPQDFENGLEGLDTEMISDEDDIDVDKSHSLKTISDGEIFSELDYTTPEEGEIVEESKEKNKKKRSSIKKIKSLDRFKVTSKKHKSRSRSETPERSKKWLKRHSKDWTPSLSPSRSPSPRFFNLSPLWTVSRITDNTIETHNLTTFVTNDVNKKKKYKKKKNKKSKKNVRGKKRIRNDGTPSPSRKVFMSGDKLFKKNKKLEESNTKDRKDKIRNKKSNSDLTEIKPDAIIDLEKSSFNKFVLSPKEIIVLSDSENEESKSQTPITKSHASLIIEDVPAADSQSSIQVTPESSLSKNKIKFEPPLNEIKLKQNEPASNFNNKPAAAANNTIFTGTKEADVKINNDSLKIFHKLPNSATKMQAKDRFLMKLNRQERVAEEAIVVLTPFYNNKDINKEEYKYILRRAVPKICHNKAAEINPRKIRILIEAYVKKVKNSKKVTSSSSLV